MQYFRFTPEMFLLYNENLSYCSLIINIRLEAYVHSLQKVSWSVDKGYKCFETEADVITFNFLEDPVVNPNSKASSNEISVELRFSLQVM